MGGVHAIGRHIRRLALRRGIRIGGRSVVAMMLVAAAGLVAPSLAAAQDGLESARRRADKATAELAEAETRASELEARVSGLEAERARLQREVDGLRSAVRDVVVRQFIHSDMELAAGAVDDPNDRAVALTLAEVAAGTNTDVVERYEALIEQADITSAQLRTETEASLKAIDALNERRDKAAREVERLARASPTPRGGRTATMTPIATGEWVCPVQGPVSFSDSWGDPRSGGRSHTGVDMLSPRGTPTVAPVTGRVVHKESALGGLTWYVYGDDGNTYYGAHLSAYANQGAGRVEAGTVIGYIGATGNANGTNHLHFQIRPGGGAPANPYPTVAKYC